MRVIAGRLLLVLVSLLVSLLLLEVVARIFLLVSPPAGPTDDWVVLRSRPAPYANSEYWSEEFVDEVMRGIKERDEGGRGLEDFEGRYLTIRDGRRRTTDQPEDFDRRLLVFGASTVLSRRVPDGLTIPSHLQRLVNQRPGRIRVENHGMVGDVLSQQFARLVQTEIGPGDIVVFYDGIAEVLVKLYVLRHRKKLRPGTDDGALRTLNWAQRVAYELRIFAGESAAARMVFDLQRNLPEVTVESRTKLHRMFGPVKQDFLRDQIRAHRLVSGKGAEFHHFLQPHLYLQEARSDHEEGIVENERKRLPGLEDAYAVAYPKLRAAMLEARAAGVSAFDISDAFDVRGPGVDIYFDGAHVNEVANALAARRIYQAIFAADAAETADTANPRS
jgi:hypothetical protein